MTQRGLIFIFWVKKLTFFVTKQTLTKTVRTTWIFYVSGKNNCFFLIETFLQQKTDKDLARVGDKACNHLTGGGKADVLPEKR